jgi:hypothetical protein
MTDFRTSQTIGELWVVDATTEIVPWVAAEAWVKTIPTTAEIVSTVHIEPWTRNTPIYCITSQLLTEVWTPSLAAVVGQRYRVMTQVV